jgi:LPS-assembly lipoprotein
MSSFRAPTLCLCLFLTAGLSACGFESLRAPKNQLSVSRPDIEIGNIPDREGQYLRNLLIDRLYTHGRPADAAQQLKFSPLDKNISNIGIQSDATATVAQMQISTQMQLVEKATGAVLLQRRLKAAGSYNLLDNQLATLVSQQNVTENILRGLGDDAVMELNLYFRRAGEAPEAPAP